MYISNDICHLLKEYLYFFHYKNGNVAAWLFVLLHKKMVSLLFFRNAENGYLPYIESMQTKPTGSLLFKEYCIILFSWMQVNTCNKVN